MKPLLAAFVVLFVAVLEVRGQQERLERSAFSRDLTGPVNQQRVTEALKEMEAERAGANAKATLGKHFRVEGPIVRVFKDAKIWAVPLRMFQLVNPFARHEEWEAAQRIRNDRNPKFWAVGEVSWH